MKNIKIRSVCITAALSLLICGCSEGQTDVQDISGEISSAVSEEAGDTGSYSEDIFENIMTDRDIVYAKKKNYLQEETELKLDIYRPDSDTESRRPVIIWIHGGGMFTGSKSESWEPVSVLAPDFAHKGYVSVSIDYRLNPEWEETNKFSETLKDAADDVASAVMWVRDNAEAYGMDENVIVLAGYSSGAEIADNFYFSNFLCDEKTVDKSGIKAVVSISGNRLFFDKTACSGDENVKCLILHGEADNINPLSDAETFLSQLGDRGEMQTMPGNNHFWLDNDEQKAFLEENITAFLLREAIGE